MYKKADEAIEESEDEDEDGNIIDNGYIDPNTMKAAIKERAKKLEEMMNVLAEVVRNTRNVVVDNLEV
mgnify:CR=1 FL=1